MNRFKTAFLSATAALIFLTSCIATPKINNNASNNSQSSRKEHLSPTTSTAIIESSLDSNNAIHTERSSESSSAPAPSSSELSTDIEKPSYNESEVSQENNFSSFLPYSNILNDYYYAISEHEQDNSHWELSAAGLVSSIVNPYWAWEDSSSLLSKTGFAILDLNGDGISELLLGWIDAPAQNMSEGYVFAVYTMIDEQIVLAVEGWERNIYYIGADLYIYNRGSNSAFSSIATKNVFSPTYDKYLQPCEMIYSQLYDGGIRWERLTNSSSIPNININVPHEELLIDKETADSILNMWFSNNTDIHSYSFSEYYP